MNVPWIRVALCLTLLLSLSSRVVLAQDETPAQKPGYDRSKDVGAKAPKNADVPFDGSAASVEANWEMWPDPEMAVTWSLVDAPDGKGKVLMTNGGKSWGTHDLVTRKKYTDFEGHVDFVLMGQRGDDLAEGYANSGVYLQNRYEIQIESPQGEDAKDPYNWKIGPHGIGAFCMEHVPDANAWRPNGQWQAFHFVFKAARWQDDKLLEPARATVWWNGVKIHDNVAIQHANGGVPVGPSPEGLKLQEHGQDVRFGNIWIVDRSQQPGQDEDMEKPVKTEVRHSMIGYRNTLVFYCFKQQRAILAMSIDNQDETFPVTGTLHRFDKATSEEGLEKWINNRHSDALFADAPQPVSSKELPEGFCKITSSKQTGTSQNPGFRGGTYKDFEVTIAIQGQEVGQGFRLPSLTDTIRVHVKGK